MYGHHADEDVGGHKSHYSDNNDDTDIDDKYYYDGIQFDECVHLRVDCFVDDDEGDKKSQHHHHNVDNKDDGDVINNNYDL